MYGNVKDFLSKFKMHRVIMNYVQTKAGERKTLGAIFTNPLKCVI